MPKEQSILVLARLLAKEGCLCDTDAPERLRVLAKPGSGAVVDLDHDMWGVVNLCTDSPDPDKGCKTWREVATHVVRRVESALACESINDVFVCTTIKSPDLKARITAKRKQGHVFITNDPNRKHILDSLPLGFYPDHLIKIRKKDVHYDSLFKMHYLVFLTTWIMHRVKIPVNCSLTMMGGALYMDVRTNQLINRPLEFDTDENLVQKGLWQPVFLDRPLQIFHDGSQHERHISWVQTIPPYLSLTKTGNQMGWEMLATTDADLWTSFASVMLQQAQTKEHVCIVAANDRDQFNILLLRSEMTLLVERSKRPAKQITYYMHPISLGSYQGHPNMVTEYIDMTIVASSFSMMAQRWTKIEDNKVVIPSPGCMIFVMISEIRGGDYTQLYPQRIAFEDYYAALVRNHEELRGMLKYYPEEMDEQGFAPHINTRMHVDIVFSKFHRFVCLAQDAYRRRMNQKEKDNSIDVTKLRVQVANLIWVLYLEANCWKCNTLPLDCFERVEQNGQSKSLYGWKKELMETVPTQDDNVAVYTVYSSNPAARV